MLSLRSKAINAARDKGSVIVELCLLIVLIFLLLTAIIDAAALMRQQSVIQEAARHAARTASAAAVSTVVCPPSGAIPNTPFQCGGESPQSAGFAGTSLTALYAACDYLDFNELEAAQWQVQLNFSYESLGQNGVASGNAIFGTVTISQVKPGGSWASISRLFVGSMLRASSSFALQFTGC